MFLPSGKEMLLIAAASLWACSGAIAQQPGGGAQPGSPSQQQTMPNQPGTTQPGSPDSAAPGTDQPQAAGDQAFLRATMEGDNAQVAMSQLAQQKSGSDDVKQFGQKMVQIHTALNQQLQPAAKQLGVDEPKGPSKKGKQEIAKLEALSGPDFDSAYIQAMAKQQQHDLKQFKDEATGGQSPGVQMAAKQDAPILEQHYQVLQRLAQVHNVTPKARSKQHGSYYALRILNRLGRGHLPKSLRRGQNRAQSAEAGTAPFFLFTGWNPDRFSSSPPACRYTVCYRRR